MHPPGTILSDLGIGDKATPLTLSVLPDIPPNSLTLRRRTVSTSTMHHMIANHSDKCKPRPVQGSNERFTKEEADALLTGVSLYGVGHWAVILKQHFNGTIRSSVDLKDKWRNMCVAASRPPGFKFRVAYFTPEFMSRVRAVQAEAARRLRLLADSQQLELREKKKAKLAKVAEVRAVRD